MRIARMALFAATLLGAGCGRNIGIKHANTWKNSGFVVTSRNDAMQGNGTQFWTIVHDTSRVSSIKLCGSDPIKTIPDGSASEAWFKINPSSCGQSVNLELINTEGSKTIVTFGGTDSLSDTQ
ncbi:MAG: hypothetical protein WC890_02245 [Candidatus Margulisiibacteriota bacterium]